MVMEMNLNAIDLPYIGRARIDVKLVTPHLPTVPADRAAIGRFVFSFSLTSASSGNAYDALPRLLPQRDII